MACLNAVASTAAASRTPVPVLNRELLHEGAIVKIDVPLDARKGQVEDEGRIIHFLQIKHYVHGGIINFFVHATDAEELNKYYGDSIVAKAKIWQKDLEDGRKFIYADFLPTVADATHEIFSLHVLNTKSQKFIPLDWISFKTPAPLTGGIVLVPLTAKKIDLVLSSPPRSQKPAVSLPGASSTGDGQLDRLLAAGWHIASQKDGVVNLVKGEKTLQHHKPKVKAKKKR